MILLKNSVGLLGTLVVLVRKSWMVENADWGWMMEAVIAQTAGGGSYEATYFEPYVCQSYCSVHA